MLPIYMTGSRNIGIWTMQNMHSKLNRKAILLYVYIYVDNRKWLQQPAQLALTPFSFPPSLTYDGGTYTYSFVLVLLAPSIEDVSHIICLVRESSIKEVS